MKLLQILKNAVATVVTSAMATFKARAVTSVKSSVPTLKSRVGMFVMSMMAMIFTAQANAALPEEVTDLFVEQAANAGLIFAAAVVLWAGIRGFMAIFKLGNKFLSKAGA